jgi:RNA polymerase sigma factor (sigma-70 family)
LRTQGLTDSVLAAARAGDQGAVRDIYEWLAPAVLGYLRAKGVADPEAVTSDVFVAVLPQLARVTGGPTGLRKLVFSIAHARMVDDHRERSRRGEADSYDAENDPRVVESAESSAQETLATQRVVAILDLLPADQREVLSLRIIADLSIDQVAEIMGKSSGAVKQLQRRGLIVIRQALAERRVTL